MRDVMTGAAICCNGTRYNAAFLGQLQGKFQATTAPESVCLEKLCEWPNLCVAKMNYSSCSYLHIWTSTIHRKSWLWTSWQRCNLPTFSSIFSCIPWLPPRATPAHLAAESYIRRQNDCGLPPSAGSIVWNGLLSVELPRHGPKCSRFVHGPSWIPQPDQESPWLGHSNWERGCSMTSGQAVWNHSIYSGWIIMIQSPDNGFW